jgi:uncharacterized Zn-finger protein
MGFSFKGNRIMASSLTPSSGDRAIVTASGAVIVPIKVATRRVSCDGGGGALGHPKVWYDLGADGRVECLYCGRIYELDGDGHGDGH